MGSKRKPISKALRLKVWEKCNKHCAYCGRELAYKDMQVDHVKSIHLNGDNNIDNLMPSCRTCNYYKGAGGVEFLRKELRQVTKRLTKPFLNRLAMSYGMMELKEWDGKFYYETIKTT